MEKGTRTRGVILEEAIRVASEVGLEGLTIGRLADALALSKSGLFAHFDSKEELQRQTLQRAAERFLEVVVRPALAEPRGEPRLRGLFERWLRWPREVPQPGGCIFVQAAVELDDRPGPARDTLVALQREFMGTLARAVKGAVDEGHLARGADPEQLAFELYGVMLTCHHHARLLRDARALARARKAFERLLDGSR